MTTPFLGEVQIYGFNFPPSKWASCNGATLSISQNSALYSLLGVAYGGNGTTTFQLPNLVNRAPCSLGTGPGLSPRSIGEPFGADSVALDVTELPRHTHQAHVYAVQQAVKTPAPGPDPTLTSGIGYELYLTNPATNTTLAPTTISMTGNNQPHDNNQPFLALTFAIALSGAFPAFN
jgi:microcystin-dependent protein